MISLTGLRHVWPWRGQHAIGSHQKDFVWPPDHKLRNTGSGDR